MTGKQAQKLKERYQKKLGLGDWKIDMKFVTNFPDDCGQIGSASTHSKYQEGDIRIKQGLSDKDLKETIVHELLHIRFGGIGFADGTAENLKFETGIEMTARALLNSNEGR